MSASHPIPELFELDGCRCPLHSAVRLHLVQASVDLQQQNTADKRRLTSLAQACACMHAHGEGPRS